MAQVLVRDIDDAVVNALKQRAQKNHRSLQRELHFILTQAVKTEGSTGSKSVRKGTHRVRGKMIPTGSVWNWLKRPSAGNLSKEEIDDYIRAERETWGAS